MQANLRPCPLSLSHPLSLYKPLLFASTANLWLCFLLSLLLTLPLSLYLPLLHPLHSLLLKFAHFVLHMLLAYDFVLYPNKSVESMTIDDTYNRQATVIHCSLICCLQMCVCVSLMRLSLERHSSFLLHLLANVAHFVFLLGYFVFVAHLCNSLLLFFYSDNFSYATNLHKKIKQQQQQERQRPRRKIVALLFFFICIGSGEKEGVFQWRGISV